MHCLCKNASGMGIRTFSWHLEFGIILNTPSMYDRPSIWGLPRLWTATMAGFSVDIDINSYWRGVKMPRSRQLGGISYEEDLCLSRAGVPRLRAKGF
jgi:hypothetical protein